MRVISPPPETLRRAHLSFGPASVVSLGSARGLVVATTGGARSLGEQFEHATMRHESGGAKRVDALMPHRVAST